MKEDSIYMQEILTSTDRPGEREEMRVFDTSMQQAKLSDAAHTTPTTLLIAAYGKAPGDGEKDLNHPMNFTWVDELKNGLLSDLIFNTAYLKIADIIFQRTSRRSDKGHYRYD